MRALRGRSIPARIENRLCGRDRSEFSGLHVGEPSAMFRKTSLNYETQTLIRRSLNFVIESDCDP
jgi:hypothetical protein